MKYLKCIGLAAVLDLAIGVVAVLKESDLASFLGGSVASLILSTLPAIGANVVDKYVNQNISDNKYFQYGATALEAGLINVGRACYSSGLDYIEKLKEVEFSGTALEAKLLFANAIVQGLLFKYILSEEEANESGDGGEVLFDDPIDDNNQLDINDNGNEINGEFQS